MTENPQPDHAEQPHHADHVEQPEAEEPFELTGHPVVDEVLESLRGLQDRPVEEHVAVFEAAHDKLRGALTDAGDQANRTGG